LGAAYAGTVSTKAAFGTLPSVVEFTFSGQGEVRDNTIFFNLVSSGNTTSTKELIILWAEVVYRSTLVSWKDGYDALSHSLR
jgi:hypothetical protein